MENKTKASCQVGNKAKKTKLINMLKGKERNIRKNGYAKLNRGRWRRYIYTLKINCNWKRIVGKANKGINVENI